MVAKYPEKEPQTQMRLGKSVGWLVVAVLSAACARPGNDDEAFLPFDAATFLLADANPPGAGANATEGNSSADAGRDGAPALAAPRGGLLSDASVRPLDGAEAAESSDADAALATQGTDATVGTESDGDDEPPAEPAPTQPAPTQPAPTQPAPTQPAPTQPAPTQPPPDQPLDASAPSCDVSSCSNLCVPYFVQCCKADETCGCALLFPRGPCE